MKGLPEAMSKLKQYKAVVVKIIVEIIFTYKIVDCRLLK